MAGLKNSEKSHKRGTGQEPDIPEDENESDTSLQLSNNEDGGNESDPGITSENSRKRQIHQEIVQKRITEVQENNLVLLDLSRKSIKEIPDILLECRSVQYLYLEGNELQVLPDNFMDKLSNLRWLDLRNNYLGSIPTTYVSRHKYLKNLLLEGNQLRTLPLELGMVTTLNGLNIANNPLEFPPAEIIERGTQAILAFFREILKAKSEGRIPPVPRLEELQQRHHSQTDEVLSSDSDELALTYSSSVSSAAKTHLSSKSSKGVRPLLSKDSVGSFYGSMEDLVGPVPTSAALHKPTSYQEMRQGQLNKLEKAGVLKPKGKSATTSSKGRHKAPREVDIYPPPPDPTMVEQTYAEERRLAKLRDLKEKQELIIQRRKDADKLQKFRDESKRMQREKHYEKMRSGGKLDFDQPAEQAPYGIEKGDLQMITNEERIAQDIKAKHEKIRQRPLSPRSMKKMEDARAERDKELEKRIKKHTEAMQERRKRPKGTPQQEMEAAMKELQVAEQLQHEIDARRKGLEYRFTAFTGEPIIPSKNRIQHAQP